MNLQRVGSKHDLVVDVADVWFRLLYFIAAIRKALPMVEGMIGEKVFGHAKFV